MICLDSLKKRAQELKSNIDGVVAQHISLTGALNEINSIIEKGESFLKASEEVVKDVEGVLQPK